MNKHSDSSLMHILNYIPGLLIPAGLNILSIMLYTRIFPPDEYGDYSLVLAWSTILVQLFSQWVQVSTLKYRSNYKGNMNYFNVNFNKLIILVSVIFTFLYLSLYILNKMFPFMDQLIFTDKYVFAILLYVLSSTLYLNIGTVYQSDLRSRNFANYNVANSIIRFSLILVLIYFVKKDVVNIFMGIAIAQIIMVIPMFLNGNILTSLNMKGNDPFKEYLYRFLGYGFPMMGWFLCSSFMLLSDRFFLDYFKGANEVGIYSANILIVTTGITLLTSPLLSAAHPIIMNEGTAKEKNTGDLSNIVNYFSKYYLMVAIPLTVFFSVYAKDLVTILLDVDYREGYLIIPITLVGYLFWNYSMYGHKGFEVQGKTRLMLILVIISCLINVISNIVLIPKLGYLGSAFASTIALTSYPCFVFYFSLKNIKWVIPYKFIVKLSTASAIIGLMVSQLTHVFSNSIIKLGIGAILFLILYALVLLKLNEAPINDIKKLFTSKIQKVLVK
ncbi:oligosaccharide flippase family protein [Neobacillus drentensis]|uniref:oligosaccharide flippase family protein n=1 Tax=Neobacillus drentensis TaxID=220684 RepID=UPI002FFE56B1